MLGEFINEGKREGVRGYGSYGHAIRTDIHWAPRTLECGRPEVAIVPKKRL